MNSSSINGAAGPISPYSNNPPNEPDIELWTTKEVAKFLRVSLKTVFNLRKRGLPYVQLGGAIRFVPQEIRDYLANSRRSSLHRFRQIIRNDEVKA